MANFGLLNFNPEDPKQLGLLNLGMGILAGNTGRPGDIGQGLMGAMGNYQQMLAQQQRQKLLDEQFKMQQEEFWWKKANAEREANAPLKVGNSLIDPKTYKPIYTDAAAAPRFGMSPRVGINPQTGKPEYVQFGETGTAQWTGIRPTKDEIAIAEAIDKGILPEGYAGGVPPSVSPTPQIAPYNISLAPGTSPEEAARIQAVAAADYAKNGANLPSQLPPASRRKILEKEAESRIVSPVDQAKLDEIEREKAAEQQKKAERARLAIGKADTVINKVDEALGMVGKTTSGPLGAILADSPVLSAAVDAMGGNNAYDLNKAVQTVKANIGFAELQAMREASPTGGALGQVAVQELESLQSTLANLDQGQSPEKLRQNLNAVKQHFKKWKETVEMQQGLGNPQAPSRPPRSRADILKQYGVR